MICKLQPNSAVLYKKIIIKRKDNSLGSKEPSWDRRPEVQRRDDENGGLDISVVTGHVRKGHPRADVQERVWCGSAVTCAAMR